MTTSSNRRDLLPFQIVMGVTAGAIGGIVATLGELREDLGFSETGIGIIVASGFLAAFVAQVTLARYADRGYGRQMATIGVAFSAVALGIMVVADDVVVWAASRALLGFAGGITMPGLRRAATVLDPERVGENLGRLIVGEVIGFIMGPAITAIMVELAGIRAPFVAFAVGMVLFLPLVIRLPADKGVLDESGRRSSFDLLTGRRLQGALILIGGYFMLIGAFESVLPVMFQDRGGGATTTGLAFTALGIPVALVSTHAGRTADRLGPPRVAILGMAVSAVAATIYGILPGLLLPILVMGVVGVADGYGFTAGQVAVSRAVEQDRQAAALGLMGAVEVLGAGVAAVPAAVLYQKTGAEIAWFVTGASVLVMLILGWFRLRGTMPVYVPDAEPADVG